MGDKMIRKLALFLFALLLALSTYSYSQERQLEVVYQKKRIALVIGNAAYKSAPLRNPTNDANDMAAVLKRFGFDVTLIINASQKTMEMAIRDFGNKIKRGGISLFYYAGHGMQVKGVNYLIPIGTNLQTEDEIKYEAVDMSRVLSKMDSAGNDMNVIILDACRDNPFARSFRSSSRGLARMDAPKGTLIVYSTSPGKTAADGEGRNGIFTKHLLKAIRETDLEVGQLLREVRREVMNETDSNQIPWESSSLIGDFYFSTIRLEPPETSSVDISSIKKAAKERERIKSKWDNWQTGMKSDFMEVEKLDKSTAYTNQEKETAWRQFLDNYKTNNPYSNEDEQLRERAEQRLKVIPPPKKSGPIITPELRIDYKRRMSDLYTFMGLSAINVGLAVWGLSDEETEPWIKAVCYGTIVFSAIGIIYFISRIPKKSSKYIKINIMPTKKGAFLNISYIF